MRVLVQDRIAPSVVRLRGRPTREYRRDCHRRALDINPAYRIEREADAQQQVHPRVFVMSNAHRLRINEGGMTIDIRYKALLQGRPDALEVLARAGLSCKVETGYRRTDKRITIAVLPEVAQFVLHTFSRQHGLKIRASSMQLFRIGQNTWQVRDMVTC